MIRILGEDGNNGCIYIDEEEVIEIILRFNNYIETEKYPPDWFRKDGESFNYYYLIHTINFQNNELLRKYKLLFSERSMQYLRQYEIYV